MEDKGVEYYPLKLYENHQTIIKYREIIFFADSPICIKFFDEFWKQLVINENVFDQKLMKEAVKKIAAKHVVKAKKMQ